MKESKITPLILVLAAFSLIVPAGPGRANIERPQGVDSLRAKPSLDISVIDTPASDSISARARRSVDRQPEVDIRVFRFFNKRISNSFFDWLMPAVTDFDNSRVVVILIWCALVIFGKTRGRWAALALIPLIVASDQISSGFLKPLFERLRPCEVLGDVHFWSEDFGWTTTPAAVTRSYKSSFSFPSSHAANITASMLFLGLVYRRLMTPLVIIAVTVSLSRIYVGVHWPLDVIAGMTLGAVLAATAFLIYKRYVPENSPSENNTGRG